MRSAVLLASSWKERRIAPMRCSCTLVSGVRGIGLAARQMHDHVDGLLQGDVVGVDDEIVMSRQFLAHLVETIQIVGAFAIRIVDRLRGVVLVEQMSLQHSLYSGGQG